MTLTDEEKINCLRLILSENIGPITYNQLLQYYGSATNALPHIDELASRGGRKKKIMLCSRGKAEEQLEQAQKSNVRMLWKSEPDYPVLLKQISDAPPILCVKGSVLALKKKSVAIVGTRNASVNGKTLARKIAFDLAEKDYNVVSGMAHGIDRAAHMGALGSPKTFATTAVLGTSINEVYPTENQDIYDQIVERGCLISEFPFGTVLNPRNFPRRNRIISGVSSGTVVIEAQEQSGSLITAKEAAAQGREVMAVPGSPVDPRSSGPNALIRDGATLVACAQDIIDTLDQTSFRLTEKKAPETYIPVPLDEVALSDARQVVWNSLNADIVSVDDLIRETGLDARLVNIILVELALAGRLERYPGNRVSMVYSME